jgi:DNA repair protein RadC
MDFVVYVRFLSMKGWLSPSWMLTRQSTLHSFFGSVVESFKEIKGIGTVNVAAIERVKTI